MQLFKQLGLSEEIVKAVEELGFEEPSEIQEKAIPILLKGEDDFIGLAQTGTGKTAAFGLPLLQQIDANNKATQALILAPTRELGQQIAQQIKLFSKFQDRLNVLAVYGGANIARQIEALKKPQQVIIATPGRLIDLINRKCIRLDRLEFLILDEADEMLNMGFKDDIDRILSYIPDTKRTWLFSATLSREIEQIVQKYMQNPKEARVSPKNEVNENIEHQYIQIRHEHKTEALVRFLDVTPDMRGIVFCRTKRETQSVSDELLKRNYKADALHGDLSQHQRDRVMQRFKRHDLQVLIATDVAARGIDVDDITHVFHHSLPDENAYYTHRSGRTARAGKKGISIAFIGGREKSRIDRMERQLKVSFKKVTVPSASDIYDTRIEKWCQDIVATKVKDEINPKIWDLVQTHLGPISKDELMGKILTQELKELNIDSLKDLNDDFSRNSGRPDKDRRKSGGGSGRSRRAFDRKREDKKGFPDSKNKEDRKYRKKRY